MSRRQLTGYFTWLQISFQPTNLFAQELSRMILNFFPEILPKRLSLLFVLLIKLILTKLNYLYKVCGFVSLFYPGNLNILPEFGSIIIVLLHVRRNVTGK